jgi:hypothetical protein
MKYNHVGALALVVALMFAWVNSAGAQGAKKEEKMEMNRYMVEVKHTPEECLKTLDEINAKSSALLSKFEWGCMSGDHTGYGIVEAESEAAVKAMLPSSMADAHIVKLNKFTPQQIKAFHAKKG